MASQPRLTAWADTTEQPPPLDHLYRSATWLLGRHPRLARLVVRVAGVVGLEDGEPVIDLDHLAQVIAAAPEYAAAWRAYEARNRQPDDDSEWDRWRDAGPAPGHFADGLSDFLVMSSGEATALRLLATFATPRTPFRVSDLTSLDEEGQRLLADWSSAVQASYGSSPRVPRHDRPVTCTTDQANHFGPCETHLPAEANAASVTRLPAVRAGAGDS